MHGYGKRLLSFLLAVVMVFSILPMNVLAEGEEHDHEHTEETQVETEPQAETEPEETEPEVTETEATEPETVAVEPAGDALVMMSPANLEKSRELLKAAGYIG